MDQDEERDALARAGGQHAAHLGRTLADLGFQIDGAGPGAIQIDEYATGGDAGQHRGFRQSVGFHHRGRPADGRGGVERQIGVVVVAAADRRDAEALVEPRLPVGHARQRTFFDAALSPLSAAVGGLDRGNPREVGSLGRPAATHAVLNRRQGRVVDRHDAAGGRRRIDEGGGGRQGLVAQTEVDEPRRAKDVGVAMKGGDLSPRDQQQRGKGGLQFAHGVEVGDGVVIGDGDEIQATVGGGLDGAIDRTRRPGRAGGKTGPVAVGGVHVQVAAVPGQARLQRPLGKGRDKSTRTGVAVPDTRCVDGGDALAQIGDA